MSEDPRSNNDGRDMIAPIVIPEVVIPPLNKHLRFSFRHLDLQHTKFKSHQCCAEFYSAFMTKMQLYSSWLVEDFCDQNNRDHRHVIFFPETTEPDGFPSVDEDQLRYHEAWQFELSKTERWRVHGILIDDTFYAVWLDPFHLLYPL